jgi:Helix-hairpin-helix motif
MNFNCKYLGFILFLLSINPQITYAQDDDTDIIEKILDILSSELGEDQDYSDIAERLTYYRKHPIDLNNATKDQLKELIFLSPIQINEILNHSLEHGPFLDVFELQSIRSLDIESINLLIKFVKVTLPPPFKDMKFKKLIQKADHDLMIRMGKILERQAGFSKLANAKEANYQGSAWRILTRYRYSFSNTLAASLNMEKDAGEQFFDSTKNKGFDFYSGNISFRGSGIVKKLLIGDYALQFGQGLVMWSGLGFGKGAGISTIAKQDFGLKPYSSVNESMFLRGASGTFKFRKLSFTPFFSKKNLDASLTDQGKEVSTINISGLHRTKSEIGNKSQLLSTIYGAHIQFNSKSLNIGFTSFQTQFSLPFSIGKSLYEQYDFRGNLLMNLGFNYDYNYRNTYFFGEVAHSKNGGSAFINGIMSSLSPRVSLVLMHRRYAKNYHSFFNQSVSEASNAVNESGFYSALSLKLDSKWDLFTYSDFFRFPWLKFRVNAPSAGYEIFTQINYRMNKKLNLSSRFKQQVREENSEANSGLETVDKQNYRIEIIYSINDRFSFRNRAEMIRYQKGNSKFELGFLNYQDIIYKPMSSRLSGNIRFGIFDTESFNSRIYAYENDVLYSYSVPAYQGKGVRFYVNARYTLIRGFDLWLRYSLTSYYDQKIVGSGDDEINGNKRSDVRMQIRYQF